MFGLYKMKEASADHAEAFVKFGVLLNCFEQGALLLSLPPAIANPFHKLGWSIAYK
jgi:hypothetical protein